MTNAWTATEAEEERLRLLAIVWDSRPHECVWCGQGTARGHATAHHLIPRGWVGSSDRPSNLAIVHVDRCHDEIEQWTADHGRQPKPDELHDQRRFGFIRESATRYVPRLDDVMGGDSLLTRLLEGLNTSDRPPAAGPVIVRMTWSPVAYLLADRLKRPGYLFAIREPAAGETAATFYARNGLRGIALPEGPTIGDHLTTDPDPRPTSNDLARDLGNGAARRDASTWPEAPDLGQETSSACPGCGGPLPPGRRGQDRATCSDRCRRRMARRNAGPISTERRNPGRPTDKDVAMAVSSTGSSVTPSRPSEPVTSDPTSSTAPNAHRLLGAVRDVRPNSISASDRSDPTLGLS